MLSQKCKKSVFCVCFLISFLVGTICATLLFQCLWCGNYAWLSQYCGALVFEFTSPVCVFLHLLRPLILMAALACLPMGHRAVFPLVFVRGFLFAFSSCAALLNGSGLSMILLKNLIIMPIFYSIGLLVFVQRPFCCNF